MTGVEGANRMKRISGGVFACGGALPLRRATCAWHGNGDQRRCKCPDRCAEGRNRTIAWPDTQPVACHDGRGLPVYQPVVCRPGTKLAVGHFLLQRDEVAHQLDCAPAPVRKLSSGQDLDLRPLLQAIDQSGLTEHPFCAGQARRQGIQGGVPGNAQGVLQLPPCIREAVPASWHTHQPCDAPYPDAPRRLTPRQSSSTTTNRFTDTVPVPAA